MEMLDASNETRSSSVPQIFAKTSINACSVRMSQANCSWLTPWRL